MGCWVDTQQSILFCADLKKTQGSAYRSKRWKYLVGYKPEKTVTTRV
jgi:hypothetical protein